MSGSDSREGDARRGSKRSSSRSRSRSQSRERRSRRDKRRSRWASDRDRSRDRSSGGRSRRERRERSRSRDSHQAPEDRQFDASAVKAAVEATKLKLQLASMTPAASQVEEKPAMLMDTMQVPEKFIKAIIGPRGETINEFKYYSSATIQIAKSPDACGTKRSLSLGGTASAIEIATRMIQEKVAELVAAGG